MGGPNQKHSASDTELVSQAFDAWDDCQAIADEGGVILRANHAWAESFGDEKSWLDDLLPEALTRRLLDDPTPTQVKIETIAGRRWMSVKVRRRNGLVFVRLAEGSTKEAAGSDRKAVDATTMILLDEAGVTGTIYDPDNDSYILTSAFPDANGLSQSRLPRALVDSTVHRADLAKITLARQQLSLKGGRSVCEIRARGPGGGFLHLKILMRAGRRLPSGKFEVISVSQDVTELVTARDEAKTTARQLGMALKAAGAGVFEIDYQTDQVYCSPAFERIFGRAFEMADVYSHRFRMPVGERITDRFRRAGLTDSAVDIRVPVHGVDRWVRIYTEVRHATDGSPLHTVGLVLDIDRAKRQELALQAAQAAAQAATEAKSQFLASMSHEIRTPMNGVVGVLHLLKAEALSPSGRGLLDEALACSDMLLQLINDLLDFSKIEAGKLDVTPAPTRPVDVLEGVMALLRPQVEAKNLSLNWGTPPGLDFVLTDPVRLRQCLFNLIGNAVKFTARGGVSVQMSQPRRGRLRVEITDTGPGIPKSAQARLFQRFEQADTAATRAHGGAGLGLAITRSLVDLMGGEIGLTSREGHGSTFWFEIDAPAVAATEGSEAEGTEREGLLSGLRILVVDDNAANRLVATKMIEAFGAAVDVVMDGPCAIEAARRVAYDLILMDVNMPGMDGLEATRQIRAQSGAAAQVPILALTANVMAHQRAQYLAGGMDGTVPKPFSPAVLAQEILRVMSGDGPDLDSALRSKN